ncbi:PEPxxWA-CTERM sorting domain-containing protein [Sphingomonas sp. A2-49]|uniref:PEPxxWA-CTERM sorting domain-containing protein n=1 Tax=Sphingomonas sp. A2-49 TaxID=1391375 RepID=UPI0021D305DC|nr:PEPxxWA-CTERM sorting domain-containing protein [Sphingomonas sp. A2-49]MCU6456115.1 PEPxxWA-CTERM sorting domain-containing protein [Sphingomonas sp. A2-49]
MKLFRNLSLAAAALFGMSSAADAAVVVTINQVGSNVVATTSGTLDLSGLTNVGSFALALSLRPTAGYIGTGATANAGVTGYSGLIGPAAFGTGADTSATSGTGLGFALNASAFGAPLVFVPTGYVSGSSLAGTALFAGRTFATLGLTAGSYVFRSAADTVTINIGAVPETASWIMMILGIGAIGYAMRRSNARFDAKIKRITAGADD